MSIHDDAQQLLNDVKKFLLQEEELHGRLLLDSSLRKPVTPRRTTPDPTDAEPALFAPPPAVAKSVIRAYPAEPWVQIGVLDDLNTSICTCTKCSLGHTRKNFVFGVGNPNAEVVFIGEAPGADEDEQGEPFVGKAGQLLNKIIEAIQFKREEVYICNILKCRPPNNREPQPEEIELCEPYLWRQLEIIKPKLILCLGRVAGQALLKTKDTLGSLRGKWHDYRGIPTMVTYHPAALLRNPNWKRPTWEDVQALRRRYDELRKT